ncbi:MAG: helix-turn-helix domain-containing protein [Gemmatimonadota bacterium]
MPDHGSPVVRGRRLAGELRRLRLRRGLTGEEVAAQLGWSESKISRIELRRTGVKEADLLRLLDLYQVAEPRRGELLALARESAHKGRLEAVAAGFPAEYSSYVQAEAEARAVWNWEPQTVPGLLQTPEYGRAMMQVWESMFAVPPGEIARRIEARQYRQQLLTRDPPLELSVVIDESVLRRQYGDHQVMRAQLKRLTELSRLANVEVVVLPLESGNPLATGAFSYMQFSRVHAVPLPDIVSVEHLEGTYYLEAETQTYPYRRAFEHLRAHSLNATASRRLITETARRMWS